MMRFNKLEFGQKVIKTGEMLQTYLKHCLLAAVDQTSTTTQWINDLFDQIQLLLKDNAISPTFKVKLTEFLIFVLLLGEPLIIRFIEQKIYPIVRSYSQYDRDLKISKRGQEYFKNHPEYIKGNESRKSDIRRMGIEYIHFFLQSIPVWANWIPHNVEDEKSISLFQKSYQMLKQGGLQFPIDKEYIVYTQQNIDKKEDFVQVIIQDFFKENGSGLTERSQKSNLDNIGGMSGFYKLSSAMKSPVSKGLGSNVLPQQQTRNTEGSNGFFKGRLPTYNQSPSDEKYPLINNQQASIKPNIITHQITTIPYNPQIIPVSTQTIQQHVHFPRSPRQKLTIPPPSTQSLPSDPRMKIPLSVSPIQNVNTSLDISPVVFPQIPIVQEPIIKRSNSLMKAQLNRQMQQKIRQLQSKHIEQISHLKMSVRQLQTEVNYLNVENSKLIQKIKEYQMKIRNMNQIKMNQPPPRVTEQIQRLKSQNAELKANILDECTELVQFTNKTTPLGSTNNSRTAVRQTICKDMIQPSLFDPYYNRLSSEEQTRFKRTILKSKEIMYKDQNIELGCLTQLQDANKLKIFLVLTSKTDNFINNIKINMSQSNGATLIEKGVPIKSLLGLAQQKQIYLFRIDDWLFEPVRFEFSYQNIGEQIQKHLILPLCRYKFMINDLQVPSLKCRIQKIVVLNKSVTASLQKLQEYSPDIFSLSKNGEYQANISCLGYQYRWKLQKVSEDCVKVSLQYSRSNDRNANILLQELAFALGR